MSGHEVESTLSMTSAQAEIVSKHLMHFDMISARDHLPREGREWRDHTVPNVRLLPGTNIVQHLPWMVRQTEHQIQFSFLPLSNLFLGHLQNC